MAQSPIKTARSGTNGNQVKSTFRAQARNGKATISSSINKRDMPALDWIHVIFLFYSGAHNAINAWHRAENGLFFIFVLVGILSVELMLWSIYKYWKAGHLVGKMLRIGKFAGLLALFYATAGILAQAQTGTANDWLSIYYQWILPSSAPLMFFFAFWIQSVDPIMMAERDTTAYSYLAAIEERKEQLDTRRMHLDEQRNKRKLRSHVMRKKLSALWKESDSRRTKSTLQRSSMTEMPLLLEEVGVSIKKANSQPRFRFLNSKYENPKQLTTGRKNENTRSLIDYIEEKK
ncbi:MAG: hypothetical protein AB8G77_04300 [Rhodothermales bacterium]